MHHHVRESDYSKLMIFMHVDGKELQDMRRSLEDIRRKAVELRDTAKLDRLTAGEDVKIRSLGAVWIKRDQARQGRVFKFSEGEEFTNALCKFCGKINLKILKCGRCKSAVYCDDKCQKSDWKEHKKECKEE